MADGEMGLLSVVDVYEAASDIGKLLEQLAEEYGSASIEKLVPKVCTILEHLEQSAARTEKQGPRFDELEQALEQIELLQKDRRKTRDRYEHEMEQLESEWREEITQLTDAVETLTAENEKLRLLSIKRRESLGIKEEPEEFFPEPLRQNLSVQNSQRSLTDAVVRHRDELRSKENELAEVQNLLTTTQAQNDRYAGLVKEHKKRYKNLQKQAQKLMKEKNDLTLEMRESLLKIISLENQLHAFKSATVAAAELPDSDLRGSEDEDGERPRFTLNELRSILNERNQLKTKVMELQDELTALRPKPTCTRETGSDIVESYEDEDNEEPAVQGPINREPDEKLFGRRKKRESTIRNLFRGMFGQFGEKSSVMKEGIFYGFKESSAHLAE